MAAMVGLDVAQLSAAGREHLRRRPRSGGPRGGVLYLDGFGELAALRRCYYLKSAARLVAADGVGVVRSAESAFCGQCLEHYDLGKPLYARECARLGYRCAVCASCPRCGAALAVRPFDEGGVRYACGHCHWDSAEALGLRAADRAALG
eukprot:CAMPEP_0118864986 /NCGR_PEP_ID=MMETSP1163-20130328/9399_1 /TAXON_ID=124430 /ORGANISM="Phaeomonas parva, Strain CCMP2877" /LENGTH=148 /DNA_ID=CAMNT_0006799173 /DNA_START=162 /DNA_END=605 /DNA_ORIENTATION=+